LLFRTFSYLELETDSLEGFVSLMHAWIKKAAPGSLAAFNDPADMTKLTNHLEAAILHRQSLLGTKVMRCCSTTSCFLCG
jgi:hypothetical protein